MLWQSRDSDFISFKYYVFSMLPYYYLVQHIVFASYCFVYSSYGFNTFEAGFQSIILILLLKLCSTSIFLTQPPE